MTNGTKGRLGMCGYARLISALRQPRTARELMEAAGIGRVAASRFVQCAHRAGWIRIVEWRVPFRSVPMPVWQFGRGVDVAPPATRPNGRPSDFAGLTPWSGPLPPELLSFFGILEALESRQTALDLAEETGVIESTARRTIEALRRGGIVRIGSWVKRPDNTGPPVAVYELGAGNDAKRPPRKERKRINADYERVRALRDTQRRLLMLPANSAAYTQSA